MVKGGRGGSVVDTVNVIYSHLFNYLDKVSMELKENSKETTTTK